MRTGNVRGCWHTAEMRNGPTGRALHLLSLLQTHRFWPGAELAERLDVTQRTVRRDVDRLRELGYPVDAAAGKYGGYRLAAGAHLPPLLLDDDEAVAVAVGLRYAAEAAIDGIGETAVRALTKIELLLPSRLRRRVSALHTNVTSMRRPAESDTIDSEALSVLAAACRDGEHVRFDYLRGDGERSARHVEPHQLVIAGRRWYLVAWDTERRDWRTFRLDRMRAPRSVGGRFAAHEVPGGDVEAFAAASLGSTPRHEQARLVIDAPFAEVEPVLRFIEHTPITLEAARSVVEIRSEDLGRLAMAVARIALTAPVTVVEHTELAATVHQLASHLRKAS